MKFYNDECVTKGKRKTEVQLICVNKYQRFNRNLLITLTGRHARPQFLCLLNNVKK